MQVVLSERCTQWQHRLVGCVFSIVELVLRVDPLVFGGRRGGSGYTGMS
jgi:hypothetical protein